VDFLSALFDYSYMFQLPSNDAKDKPSLYAVLAADLRVLLHTDRFWLTNTANAAALLFARLPELNWAGFYLLRGNELMLGPFQGKPACTRIAIGRGVCGTAAELRATVVVPNVHEFSGHIACDGASNSEIVVPLICGERLLGVLDLDSPRLERFDQEDREGLEAFSRILIESSDWPDTW
jgi:L-methionine (R)-S-oxide reductase